MLNNRDLNQVTWEQRAMEGDPKFEASQDLPDFPYAEFARMAGLKGVRAARLERRSPDAWRQALSSDRPFLLEARDRSERAAAAASHHSQAGPRR